MEEKYDQPGSFRPFRLWDAAKKRNIRWRHYKTEKRAHIAALIETRWAKIGDSIEVYDCRSGKLKGQYTRRVNNVEFLGE